MRIVCVIGVLLLVGAVCGGGTKEVVVEGKAAGADEVVVVAPLSVIQRLVELGLRPLWAEMEAIEAAGELDPEREVDAPGGRRYRFRRFRRIVGVKIQFEEVGE